MSTWDAHAYRLFGAEDVGRIPATLLRRLGFADGLPFVRRMFDLLASILGRVMVGAASMALGFVVVSLLAGPAPGPRNYYGQDCPADDRECREAEQFDRDQAAAGLDLNDEAQIALFRSRLDDLRRKRYLHPD